MAKQPRFPHFFEANFVAEFTEERTKEGNFYRVGKKKMH
jgi:hypothetical protein